MWVFHSFLPVWLEASSSPPPTRDQSPRFRPPRSLPIRGPHDLLSLPLMMPSSGSLGGEGVTVPCLVPLFLWPGINLGSPSLLVLPQAASPQRTRAPSRSCCTSAPPPSWSTLSTRAPSCRPQTGRPGSWPVMGRPHSCRRNCETPCGGCWGAPAGAASRWPRSTSGFWVRPSPQSPVGGHGARSVQDKGPIRGATHYVAKPQQRMKQNRGSDNHVPQLKAGTGDTRRARRPGPPCKSQIMPLPKCCGTEEINTSFL